LGNRRATFENAQFPLGPSAAQAFWGLEPRVPLLSAEYTEAWPRYTAVPAVYSGCTQG